MSKIGVETSQHVQLNYRVAGVVERILAYLVDAFILGIYYFSMTLFQEAQGEDFIFAEMNDMLVSLLLVFLPMWFYHLFMEIFWNGYTVGKWLLGIRVVKIDGTRPELSSYLLRWFIRLFEVTLTSGGLALITILLNGKGQRLGDIAGKTCVIKVGRSTSLKDTVFEDFKDDYEAVFPQVIELSDEDISLINDLLRARSKYEESTWLNMMARAKKVLEEKMGLPESKMGPIQFLHQVKRDYNALHGVLE